MPTLAHRSARVAQTPRTFSNWPHVLLTLARGRGGLQSVEFVTRGGLRMSCPNVAGARVPVYEVFAEDCYRLDSFLGPLLGEPITVIDIGAHVGAFACQLASKAPHARIHCFEPSPVTAGYLRSNIADNDFGNRLFVSQLAVSTRPGQAVLADNGGGSALNSLVDGPANDSGVTVQTTTFDAIVEEIGGVADVVKIDCEGGEYDLVFGSSAERWFSVRRLVLEYHQHADYAWPELRRWFSERGLTVTAEHAESPVQGTAWLERRG